MPDVGRVTPGKPIWPESHRDEPQRKRDEQEAPEKREKRPSQDANDKRDPPAGGHIDEYV